MNRRVENNSLTKRKFFITIQKAKGRVPERFIRPVLKTVVRASVPWVRIPPLPPFKRALTALFLCDFEYRIYRKYPLSVC